LNKKLQQFVATKYEEAGFIKFAKDIRFVHDARGICSVACAVIQRLACNDPDGFGKELHNVCTKGETSHDS